MENERKIKMKHITASMLVIGDEILSGRTKDKNIGWLAEKLKLLNIQFLEARIIADNKIEIKKNILELSHKHTYVFTSGGIGPTHDDITTESIAEAFDRKVKTNKIALEKLEQHYKNTNLEFNKYRRKMAKIPEGSDLIENPVSIAPGFKLNNIFVMAGVPLIFQSMFNSFSDNLVGGDRKYSANLKCYVGEGTIASILTEINNQFTEISIGSYPWFKPGNFGTPLVITGFNKLMVEEVKEHILNRLSLEKFKVEIN